MIRYARFHTRLGRMYATAERAAVTGIYFEGGRHAPAPSPRWREAPDDPLLAECARQLHEFVEGRRREFALALAAAGTAFQRAIWREIARVPFGATLTYAELARRAGAPSAIRAAGAATGRNPLSIVVPCHRIVGATGSLTGYAGGLERKVALLALESAAARLAA